MIFLLYIVARLDRATYQTGRDSVLLVGPPVEPGGDRGGASP